MATYSVLHAKSESHACSGDRGNIQDVKTGVSRKAASSLKVTKRISHKQNSMANSFTAWNQELIHKSWHTLFSGIEKAEIVPSIFAFYAQLLNSQ